MSRFTKDPSQPTPTIPAEAPTEGLGEAEPDPTSANDASAPSGLRASFRRLVVAVTTADPSAIERATRQLGASRRWLAPLGWAAGTIVLLVTGVKLLLFNWRLSLIQLVPAAWIWIGMWNIKQHFFHGRSFESLDWLELLGIGLALIVLTIAAFWCNAVFAFAIEGPPPPRIRPAVRRARSGLPIILGAGVVLGVLIGVAGLLVPRKAGLWWFGLIFGLVLVAMLVSFVAVPARIIGVRPKRVSVKQKVTGAAAGGALSAVAMAPGFVLDRLGLIFLGIGGLEVLGFILLSIGTALYAAGMSSVKAVKLSSKLVTEPL